LLSQEETINADKGQQLEQENGRESALAEGDKGASKIGNEVSTPATGVDTGSMVSTILSTD
jgi:hypothetical protein